MLVKHILDGKSNAVRHVAPGDTISAATKLLAEHRIGVLTVSSDGVALDGILSERDIVRGIAQSGASALTGTVADLMTKNVECCTVEETVASVLERMSRGNFRHMPVMTEGKVAGMISIRDIMRARTAEIEAENSALTGMIAGY
ncbi:MAG: CBS domain-containing protein [Rubricella sp.]